MSENKKLTRKDMFSIIYHFANGNQNYDKPEVREAITKFAKEEIVKLEQKAAKTKATRSKKSEANNKIAETIQSRILSTDESGALTASEIANVLDLTVQKVTPILSKLVDEGIAVRKEYPKRVKKYLLAQ